MKNKFYFLKATSLLALLFALTQSCTTKATSDPIPLPSGNFSGQFVAIHSNSKTGKLDTSKANINLSMSTAGYAVTGDTSTVHAGSKGNYYINAQYVQFIDNTVTATTNLNVGKKHLNGTYQYSYDGNNFSFFLSLDTIGYTYILKKN